jgi:hypothetical protein
VIIGQSSQLAIAGLCFEDPLTERNSRRYAAAPLFFLRQIFKLEYVLPARSL